MEKRIIITLLMMAASLLGGISLAGSSTLPVKDWYIRPSSEVSVSGESLSMSPSLDGWIKVQAPSTVLGGLCQAGVIQDIFFDDNLSKIDGRQFEEPWWYLTTFSLENFDPKLEDLRIVFEGINYRADVWLNGQRIMDSDRTFGAYRIFSEDITELVSEENCLAVMVTPPEVGDFYMGFVDWAPVPPDHNMGIFRPVLLKRSGKVVIDNLYVRSDLDVTTFRKAGLEVCADISNHADESRKALLEIEVAGKRIKRRVCLEPGETKTVSLSHERCRKLRISNPRVWWPNGLGSPELYTLALRVKSSKAVSDEASVRFGIRKVETCLDDRGVRGYKINGRPTLIKGAGFCDDLFLRNDRKRYEEEIRYVKEMGLNCLRLEGMWGTGQDLYDLCDENGILLMPGWSCQWEWPDYLGYEMVVKDEDQNIAINDGIEKYGVQMSEQQELVLAEYFEDQVKWLRNHPSIFVWVVGSDGMPKASLETRYSEVLKSYDRDRSLLVSAGDFESVVSGPTGMKMNGPYDYVAPVYWYEDNTLGGAFGFNTEVGPGPQVPLRGSLEKMIPKSRLWPCGNSSWIFHSGQKNFASLDVYLDAITNRYGPAASLDDFEMKAQWINYEAVKAMFEAHLVRRPEATGVIQWQLNSPWPELYWQLYDWYLMPTGAYFGVKKACQEFNLIYNYHDRKVYVCSDSGNSLKGCDVSVSLYDASSSEIFHFEDRLDIPSLSSEPILELPALGDSSGTFFLKTEIRDKGGSLVADNFYWLSGQEDVVDWDQYFWCYSPTARYADFRGLSTLPPASVDVSLLEVSSGKARIRFENKSDKIAFCLQSVLYGSDEDYVTPVYWSDNYISLTGGEVKEVSVEFSEDISSWYLTVEGVNVVKHKLEHKTKQ